MVINSEQKLKSLIKEKKVPNICLIMGDESALVTNCVNKICSFFSEDKVLFNGSDIDFKKLESDSEVISFFGTKRVFYIRELAASQIDKLSDVMRDFPSDSVLVITLSTELNDKKKQSAKPLKGFIELVDSIGLVCALDKPDFITLVNYIISYISKKNKNISNENAEYLIRHCGFDLLTLFNECDKLVAYADGVNIKRDDINACTTAILEDAIFDIQRMMLQGNKRRTFKLIEDLIAQKNPPAKILSILENNFSEYYKILVGKNIGLSSKEIGEAIKENRPWIIKNALSDASHVNVSRIFNVCQILLNADESFKSKVTDERICLENAVNESLIALFGEKA